MTADEDSTLDALVRRGKPATPTLSPTAVALESLVALEARIAALEDLITSLLSLSSRVENLELELEMTGNNTSRVKRIEARLDRIASRTMLHLRQEHKIAVGANL